MHINIYTYLLILLALLPIGAEAQGLLGRQLAGRSHILVEPCDTCAIYYIALDTITIRGLARRLIDSAGAGTAGWIPTTEVSDSTSSRPVTNYGDTSYVLKYPLRDKMLVSGYTQFNDVGGAAVDDSAIFSALGPYLTSLPLPAEAVRVTSFRLQIGWPGNPQEFAASFNSAQPIGGDSTVIIAHLINQGSQYYLRIYKHDADATPASPFITQGTLVGSQQIPANRFPGNQSVNLHLGLYIERRRW